MDEEQIIEELKEGFIRSMDHSDMVEFLNMEDDIQSKVKEKIDELYESTGMIGVMKELGWAGFETKEYLASLGVFL